MITLTELKDMLFHVQFSVVSYVSVVYLVGWVRDPQLRWFWQAYAHGVDDHFPLSVDAAIPVIFFLN